MKLISNKPIFLFFLVTLLLEYIKTQVCTQYTCIDDTKKDTCYFKASPLLYNMHECKYSEFCDLKSGNCKTKLYPKYQQYNGGPCNDDSDCLNGICDLTRNSCAKQIPESLDCKSSLDCKIGFYCSIDLKTCQPLKKFNDTCFAEEECQVNLSCSPEKNLCVDYFSLPENSTVYDRNYLCASAITFETKCSEAKLISNFDCTETLYCAYYNDKSDLRINTTLACKCGINPYGGKLCDYGAGAPAVSKQIQLYKDIIANQDARFCHTTERLKPCVAKAFDFRNKTAESVYKMNVNKNFYLDNLFKNVNSNYNNVNENDKNEIELQIEKKSSSGFHHLKYLDYANYDFLNDVKIPTRKNLNKNNDSNKKLTKNLIENSKKLEATVINKFEYDKQMRKINNFLTVNSNQFKNNTEDYCGYSVVGNYNKYLVPPISTKNCLKFECTSKTNFCLQSYNPNNWDSSNITVSLNNNICSKKNNERCYYNPSEIFALENYTGYCVKNAPDPKIQYKRFPGEACRDDADCLNKLCVKGYCYCKSRGDICEKDNPKDTHFCGLGFYCGRHNTSSRNDTCIDLKGTGEECASSYDCKMNLVCYSGVCAKELFSIENDKRIFEENLNDEFIRNNPNLLCKSGYYDKTNKICARYFLLNKTNADGYAECDINNENSCVYQVQSDVNNYTFTRECTCGYNSNGKAYCPIDYGKCIFLFNDKLKF